MGLISFRSAITRRTDAVSLLARPTGSMAAGPRFGVIGRLGWGVADQAVSSASNFVLGVFVARSLGSERFGAFSLAYVTYAMVLSATRGLATDPLLVRFSGAPSTPWRKAAAAATATAMTAGTIAGAICLIVGWFLPTEVGAGFMALGVALPGMMLQDSLRFLLFSIGRPGGALINDLVWGLSLVATLAGLLLTGHVTVTNCVLAFGGTAALAALFGLLQCRISPRPMSVRRWLVDQKDLGTRYLVENLSLASASQIRVFVLGAVAGLAAVGHVRAAEMLMGPFVVILTGTSQVAVPEASHVLKSDPHKLRRFCLWLGVVLAAAAACWGVSIFALLSTGLGDMLLGHVWAAARPLLTPVSITMASAGFTVSAAAAVRAMGAARRSLTAQLISAVLYLVAGVVGAVVGGAPGCCWGVAIATAAGALVWWMQLGRALNDRLSASPGPGRVGVAVPFSSERSLRAGGGTR